MTAHRFFRGTRAGAIARVVAAAAAVAACDSSVAPHDDALDVLEVILVGDAGDVIFSHSDHWHGAPVVDAADSVGYALHFSSIRSGSDDHDAPPVETWFTLEPHPEYSVRVVVEDTLVARWSGDRTRGTLHGLHAGASRLSLVVMRGPTTVYEAPPLNFIVRP